MADKQENGLVVDLGGYVNRHSRRSKFSRLLWEISWGLLARHTPRWCLKKWRVALLRIFGAKVGSECSIHGSAQIWMPGNLALGDRCWVDDDARLYSAAKISMGHDCVISARATLCTASHDISSPVFELITRPVTLGNYVWVASDAIVLPGVSLGDGCVVGAGAVVAHDVEPWTVVAGNPARVVKKRVVGCGNVA